MAKLRVASAFLVEQLFSGARPLVRITGAELDGDHVILTVDGPDVPDAERVEIAYRLERGAGDAPDMIRVSLRAI